MNASVIREYQRKAEKANTFGEYKAIGRELRDMFGLSDREALDLLRNERVIEIMRNHEDARLAARDGGEQ